MELKIIGEKAKQAETALAKFSQPDIDAALLNCADLLIERAQDILGANEADMSAGVTAGMNQGLLDRLLLTEKRIEAMAEGIREVAALNTPVGSIEEMKKRPNGLMIGKMRVPLGVIGIIYEARPNVTADAFALCFKSRNICVLKGGSAAIHSNSAIAEALREGLEKAGIPGDCLQFIDSTDRETTLQLMKLREYVDVLIPRGSAGLIRTVVENSTIPVIETGTGNCHIFVDESADINNAIDIILNAKTQRVGVCNACESLLVHKNIAKELLPLLSVRLSKKNVKMRCDEISLPLCIGAEAADETDWGREYLDYIISIKIVSSVDEAIAHINKYNTGHSEAILTNDYTNSGKFLEQVDAAAVYVNASTRFTDGFEFGFGAEIGISTQKLHARGPMGLEALTTIKYVITGNGQVRP